MITNLHQKLFAENGSDNISSGTNFGRNAGGITVKVTKGTTTDTTLSASNAYCTVTY